jgi:MGT family glycosyltransferase
MRFILAAPSVDGHLNPILSIAELLMQRGHEVRVATGENRRERVEKRGLPFASFAQEAGNTVFDMAAVLPKLTGLSGFERTMLQVRELYFAPMDALYQGLLRIDAEFSADAIIASAMFSGTIPYFLSSLKDRPSIIQCSFNPLMIARDDGAPYGPGLPPATTEQQHAEYKEKRKQIDAVLFDPVQECVDAGLETLGLGPLPMRGIEALVRLPDVFLEFTIPGFEYPRRELPASVSFVGPLPPPRSHVTDPSWLRELDGSKKNVLVTQGTLANYDLSELIEPALEGLAGEEDILVLATTGGNPAENLSRPVPRNARVATYLPFDRILPKIDLLLTNGGYGTVNMALAMGIPCVVAGISEEKAETAARVAWSGAGINLRTSTPTADTLRSAVREVLTDRKYAQNAMRLANEYAEYDAEMAVIAAAENCRRLRPKLSPLEWSEDQSGSPSLKPSFQTS